MLVLTRDAGYQLLTRQPTPCFDAPLVPKCPRSLDSHTYKAWLCIYQKYVEDVVTYVLTTLSNDLSCVVSPDAPRRIAKYLYRTSSNADKRFHFLK